MPRVRKQHDAMPEPALRLAERDWLTELGQTGLAYQGGLVTEEWLRQLQHERGRRAYREMAESDPVVGALLYAIEYLLRAVQWTAEPGGETPEDERAAEYLSTLLDDMSHSWGDFISEWMAAPIYGFAPFEIVLKYRRGEQETPGLSSRHDDGLLGLRKLAIRHPDTVEQWVFDEAGGVRALVQRAPPRYERVTIPIEKLLIFRVRPRKGNPEGTSLLRNSFVPWYRKKRIEDIEAVGIERDLAGLPVLYTPPEWHLDPTQAQKLDEAKRMVRNIRQDEQAGIVLPSVFDEQGHRTLEFSLVASGGARRIDTGPIVERYDRRILMPILADVIMIGHEKVGSFALAESKTELFAAGLGGLLDSIAETLNRHLVPRLMRLNGFRPERPPRFTHGDIESRDIGPIAEALAQLAAAGFPLFPSEDGELEREVLRIMNLPVPEHFPAPRPAPMASPGAEEEEEEDEGESEERTPGRPAEEEDEEAE